MEHKNGTGVSVIVFDVDNTLVKGNLTFFFLAHLAKQNFYSFYKCLGLLAHGALLTLKHLPSIAKKTLLKPGNIHQLDLIIYKAIKNFYQKFFDTLNKLNVSKNDIKKIAQTLFSEQFFKKHVYEQAINKIEHHLNNDSNIVVLLSGSPQEIISPFLQTMCNELNKRNISWKKRLFAIGTQIGEIKNNIHPCIGSQKIIMLKKLLTKKNLTPYTISFIYSDNGFMADLPLLLEAKNGAGLICRKSRLYQLLPKKLLESLVFLPGWARKAG
ncbi:haloacid dehalogenase-like hydrolase [Candidatus Babeliales bacterium]|nr:haloacid dehalogenase-like hydrolase [Candidatus Babeliales bacterium]